MQIKGKVHCFFEQSGTFKQEFIKLGIPAEDYDIQNDYGQTDHTDDLFVAIEDAYAGKQSLFDTITPDDLIMAFFPCIYFCENNRLLFDGTSLNYIHMTRSEIVNYILRRGGAREYFWEMILKLFFIVEQRGLRMILENPYSSQHYLLSHFPYKPSLIDHNRRLRGDYYVKPTMYFYVNCEPTSGRSYTQPKELRVIQHGSPGKAAGICSAERSEISPDYARNFICDFILGKVQSNTQLSLF